MGVGVLGNCLLNKESQNKTHHAQGGWTTDWGYLHRYLELEDGGGGVSWVCCGRGNSRGSNIKKGEPVNK